MNPNDTTVDTNQQQQKSKTTIRVAHNRENPFVMINRSALRHPKLTLKARGLWAYLLSYPDDWEFNMAHLVSTLPEGRTAIYNAFDELIEHGYVIRLQYHGSKAHNTVGFQKLQYIIFEFPSTPEEREHKYTEFEKNCIHSGQIKIKSVHSGFVNTGSVNTGNQPLRNTDCIQESEDTDISAPSDDVAPVLPPPSLATKKIEFANPANHPGYEAFNAKYGPLVGLLLDQHNALVAKHGREVVTRAYEYLASWKISKAETDAKAITKHTDYYRLTKWVIKEIIESGTSTPGTYKRTGKLAISADVRAMEEMKANPRKIQTEEEMEAWAEQRLKDLESKSQKVKS